MKTVLLIEDEAVLRIGTARGLSKLPGIDVIAVGTMAEASEVLDTLAPALVISDLDLPDRIGLEVLGELGRRDQHPPVIFVTAFLRAFRSQIPRHARVTVFEKPLELDRLRAQVTATLGLTIVGAPAPFTPADYLQLACMGNHSVEIELTRGDGTGGRVIVMRGEAWAARDHQGGGEAAFARLAFANDGLVTCRTLVGAPGPRDLSRGWEAMLMDAARALDEGKRGRPPTERPVEPAAAAGPDDQADALGFEPPAFEPPAFEPPAFEPPVQAAPTIAHAPSPAAASPASTTTSSADAYDLAWEHGVSALLRKDYPAAWTAFVAALALRPGDPVALANLARLRDLGHGGEPPTSEPRP